MPVEFILAPPAAGKTQTCLERIQAVREANPLATVWVLVPDAQNQAYFRQRLARAGGGLGVNVGTFRALYTDLLERQGLFTPVITPALEHRLVGQVVEAAFTAGELAHYAAIKHKPGFIAALQDIFSELRSAYITPDHFLAYTQNARPARRELAYLYDQFVDQLGKINWIDLRGQIWEAIAAMAAEPQAAAHIRLLVVDGFSAFAGARLAFLKQLAQQVGDLLITLPGRPGSPRPVHRRSQQVIDTLMAELSPRVTELTRPPNLPPATAHMEGHVLDPGEHAKIQESRPIFIEAGSQWEEAREALRWIKERHLRHGLPLADCALFVSHLGAYRPLLRAAASEFGLNVHFSHPDPLSDSPAVQSLLNFLEMPLNDYTTRAVFNALRSPYFDFGLTWEVIDHLELISQKGRVVSGWDQWAEAWEMLANTGREADETLDDERRKYNPLRHEDLPGLQARFNHFWHIFDGIAENRSQTAWVAWLESTLENLRFFNRLSGERDLEAWQTLAETLAALALSEQVLGDRSIDYARFLSDLQGAVQGTRLDEPRAARQDALFIGPIHQAAASRYSAVGLLGFSEGLFPVVEHPDPFLDETTRADLGLDPQLGREQASTFYQAFTRADRHLLITRPYLAEHGESWDPSPYWQAAASLFTSDAVMKISPNKTRPQADAASPDELLFWAVQQNTLSYPLEAHLHAGWQDLKQARTILTARRSKSQSSPYEGDTAPIAPFLAEKFGPGHVWSASRLETYGTCPHQFYTQNVLNLEPKEPPELGLDAAQLGSILHEILEKVYRDADSTTDLDALLAILEDTAATVFADAPRKEGFRPSTLWEVEKAQLIDTLRETIEALHQARGDWTPLHFEAKFGIGDRPSLALDLDGEAVHLRGVIDRVDQNSAGMIRVIDYKTGGANLANADLITGRRLQMPIYALAAQEALELGPVEEGFYWKIRDAQASPFKLSKFAFEEQQGPQAAYAVMRNHIKKYLVGIRAGRFPPIPPKDGCPKYCPAVQWCWRYQAGY